MGQMIQGQHGAGAQRYNAELLAAYMRAHAWLYDPDYSLAQDPEFYEKAGRDGAVADAMQQRQHVVAGNAWNIQPQGKSPEAKLLALFVERCLGSECLRRFDTARFLLARAVFRGLTCARMYGERRMISVDGIGEVEAWVPTELRDMDKRRFRRRMVGGELVLEYWPVAQDGALSASWLRVDHPEWLVRHTYNEDEASLGHGRGLSEPLYQALRCKALTVLAMNQAVERFGQGLLAYKADMSAANALGVTMEQALRDAVERIAKLRAQGIIAFDSRDDLALLEGSGTGYEMIKFALTYHDGIIELLILGSNLPSQAESGSLALGKVQQGTREARVAYDRKILAETLDSDLVGAVLRYNAPLLRALGLDRTPRPRFVITDEKHTDPKEAIGVIQGAVGAGMDLRKDEAYDSIGYTVPGANDEVIKGRSAPDPFAGLASGMPGVTYSPARDGAPEEAA